MSQTKTGNNDSNSSTQTASSNQNHNNTNTNNNATVSTRTKSKTKTKTNTNTTSNISSTNNNHTSNHTSNKTSKNNHSTSSTQQRNKQNSTHPSTQNTFIRNRRKPRQSANLTNNINRANNTRMMNSKNTHKRERAKKERASFDNSLLAVDGKGKVNISQNYEDGHYDMDNKNNRYNPLRVTTKFQSHSKPEYFQLNKSSNQNKWIADKSNNTNKQNAPVISSTKKAVEYNHIHSMCDNYFHVHQHRTASPPPTNPSTEQQQQESLFNELHNTNDMIKNDKCSYHEWHFDCSCKSWFDQNDSQLYEKLFINKMAKYNSPQLKELPQIIIHNVDIKLDTPEPLFFDGWCGLCQLLSDAGNPHWKEIGENDYYQFRIFASKKNDNVINTNIFSSGYAQSSSNHIRIYLYPECPFIQKNPNWADLLQQNWVNQNPFGKNTSLSFNKYEDTFQIRIQIPICATKASDARYYIERLIDDTNKQQSDFHLKSDQIISHWRDKKDMEIWHVKLRGKMPSNMPKQLGWSLRKCTVRYENDVLTDLQQYSKFIPKCKYCLRSGHIMKECKKYLAEKNKMINEVKKNWTLSNSEKNLQISRWRIKHGACGNCGQFDHETSQCTNKSFCNDCQIHGHCSARTYDCPKLLSKATLIMEYSPYFNQARLHTHNVPPPPSTDTTPDNISNLWYSKDNRKRLQILQILKDKNITDFCNNKENIHRLIDLDITGDTDEKDIRILLARDVYKIDTKQLKPLFIKQNLWKYFVSHYNINEITDVIDTNMATTTNNNNEIPDIDVQLDSHIDNDNKSEDNTSNKDRDEDDEKAITLPSKKDLIERDKVFMDKLHHDQFVLDTEIIQLEAMFESYSNAIGIFQSDPLRQPLNNPLINYTTTFDQIESYEAEIAKIINQSSPVDWSSQTATTIEQRQFDSGQKKHPKNTINSIQSQNNNNNNNNNSINNNPTSYYPTASNLNDSTKAAVAGNQQHKSPQQQPYGKKDGPARGMKDDRQSKDNNHT